MRSKAVRTALVAMVSMLLGACTPGESEGPDPDPALIDPAPAATVTLAIEPTQEPADAGGVEAWVEPTYLMASSELASNCLNYPAEQITRGSAVRLTVGVREGEPAIDFSLMGSDGNEYALSELLRTKPVLVVLGGFT